MSKVVTFSTRSERLPTVIASLVFLLPGVASVVIGVLTWFSLTWIENSANGLLLGITGLIWAAVGVGILSFQRWITVDGEAGQVLRGTRTVFRHPTDRQPLDAFGLIEVFDQPVADQRFYVVALTWLKDRRPRRFAHQDHLWLTTTATVEEARAEAERVVSATGLRVVDRTRGEQP